MPGGSKYKFHIEEDSGQDSFLDVVANIVGVLIILVMVVGLQASYGSSVPESKTSVVTEEVLIQPSNPDTSLARDELKLLSRKVENVRKRLQEETVKLVSVRQESKAFDQQRITLAKHQQIIEEDLSRRRKALDTERQREYDVQQQLFELQLDLEKMTQEQLTLLSENETRDVECVPTPLARTIDGPALHLRLRHGLVSIVPFQKLEEEVQLQLENIRRRLQGRDGVQETFGPIDGYRLKFLVAKQQGTGAITGRIVGNIERTSVEFLMKYIPVSERMGQNIEQALIPGSTLHTKLEKNRRQRYPVVVWLYNDSFDEFRILKRELWEMGFAVAIRPLEPGMHIMASSRGSKASAQ